MKTVLKTLAGLIDEAEKLPNPSGQLKVGTGLLRAALRMFEAHAKKAEEAPPAPPAPPHE